MLQDDQLNNVNKLESCKFIRKYFKKGRTKIEYQLWAD